MDSADAKAPRQRFSGRNSHQSGPWLLQYGDRSDAAVPHATSIPGYTSMASLASGGGGAASAQVASSHNHSASGQHAGVRSHPLDKSIFNSSIDKLQPLRIPQRPRQPAAEKERQGSAYSTDLLEYISNCMELLLEVHSSGANVKRMSTGTCSVSTGTLLPVGQMAGKTLGEQSVELDGGVVAYEGTDTSFSADARRQGPAYLDKAWPANVLIRPALSGVGPQISKEKARQLMGRSMTSRLSERNKLFGNHDSMTRGRSLSHLFRVRDPNSSFLRYFDVLCMLALANDILVTPFALAWEVSMTTPVLTAATVAAGYWTIFIILKFFTGYYESGELRMSRIEVAKRYMRSTFLFDASLTVMDWTMIILRQESADRNLRLLRLVRMVKIFRMARVWELVETLVEHYARAGGRSKLVVYLIQVAIITALFCHVMCCAWYWVGRDGESDTGHRWLDIWLHSQEVEHEALEALGHVGAWHATDLYQYCTCFHWTLAQLTLGSSDVYPVNSTERILNVALLLTGVIFNATIVSLISSQALEFIANRREQTMKINTLRRYLDQHKVHTKLAVRVQRQVVDRISASATLLFEEDVRALEMLSADLHEQVMLEVKMPPLLGHALFRVWLDADEKALKALCRRLKFEAFKAQDCVFRPGTDAQGMGRVTEGRLVYAQDRETSKEADSVVCDVERGATISEAALWSKWKHVGKLECVKPCSMLVVTADGLFETLHQFPLIHHITKQYGRAFHLRITLARPPYSGWPNDLSVPHTSPSDLLEQDIGLQMLIRERQRPKTESLIAGMEEDEYNELVAEVEAEKCAIQSSDDGALERIVALVCVQIVRDDARIFCQLGKYDKHKGSLSASCALPGVKRPRGELPGQTCERLLKKDLAFIARGLELLGADTQVEVKESLSCGLLTKYLRTVQQATLDASFEWPHDLVEVVAAEAFPSRSHRQATSRQRSGRSTSKPHLEEDVEGDLVDEPIILHEQDSKVVLYAWLTHPTYQFLRSDSGKSTLERWVSSIDIMGSLGAAQSPPASPFEHLDDPSDTGVWEMSEGNKSPPVDDSSPHQVASWEVPSLPSQKVCFFPPGAKVSNI
mmetsp:Transcript_31365/g.73159  ORF Transcript_31365/g.73159 Transcript_31365/m.73159 type:complete len:1088 (+) Transcript_31365:133-3396(+)